MSEIKIGELEMARLARSEILIGTEKVPGSTTPMLVVRAMIDSPPEAVWKHIDQSSRYAEFMPRVKEARELSRDGDRIRTRMTVEMPFPLKNLTATTQARHIVDPGVRYVREWTLEEGDYNVNAGRWIFEPFAGDATRTLAEYRVHVVPKIPVPKALKTAAQEKAMPKMIAALRARAKT
jgi:ribosome-associated toxin RatA of RatAB toxin-antitoxin module